MRPIPFPQANRVLTVPEGMKDCDPMQVYAADDFVLSKWELNASDLAEIQRTGLLYIYVFSDTGTSPPIGPTVMDPFAPKEPT